jgi:hypothetical protein
VSKVKVNYLHGHLDRFPEDVGDLSAEEGERFHQDIKRERIPSIFNDESTGSFICLRRHIYMSHVLLLHISFLRVLVVLYLRVTCICVA